MTHLSPDVEACVQECTRCHHVCLESVSHCLEKGGSSAEPSHIRLLMDCSAICAASADFMLHSSDHYQSVCVVCAQVSEACAVACERLSDDLDMRECAAICRSCAESCRQVASVAREHDKENKRE
jgi:hypothetical protein